MQKYVGSKCADTHVHEILGSVKLADHVCQAHNHRMAAVSGLPIALKCGDHVHDVCFGTDSYEDHVHAFSGRTGGAIRTGDGHVHYLEGMVTCADRHRHCFKLTTLIDNPIGD